VTDLSFDRELYDGEAVDQAVKVFGPFATFELSENPEQWVVRITGETEARESNVARELGNYALGITIHRRMRA
jgi:hypothetical protein